MVYLVSADAIRYLDTSWNWIKLGGALCPSVFYGVGLCEYDFTYEDQVIESQNDDSDDD